MYISTIGWLTSISLVLACFFASCTKEIPYKQDNFKPIMVLNAIWGENDSMSLELGSSIGILDDTTRVFINNANVAISSDAVNYAVTGKGDGQYTSLAIATAGKKYTIRATAPGFDGITATAEMPNKINATLPDTAETVIANELIDIVIQDPPKTNFYMIEVNARRYEYVYDVFNRLIDSILIWDPLPFRNLNKIFVSDLEIVSKTTSFELFDDRLFNGRNYTLQVEIPLVSIIENPLKSEVMYYEIKLKSISSDYYNFLRNYLIARPIYGGPFESYREVPSNVQGGAGIFGLYSGLRDTVLREN